MKKRSRLHEVESVIRAKRLFCLEYGESNFNGPLLTLRNARQLALKSYTRARRQAQSGPFPSFTTTYLQQNIDSSLPDELVLWLASASERFLKHIAPHCEFQIAPKSLFPLWANVHRAGEYHASHNHALGECVLSGVLFLSNETEGSGHLVLESSTMPSVGGKFDAVYRPDDRVSILPVMGKLVLFPPIVRHYVTPHSGASRRVSIAFNVNPQLMLQNNH